MMTGRWPHELSVGPDLPLDGTFPTLAEALGREGYATAGFVGNTFYCSALYGLGRGFARYEDVYENQNVSLFETVRSSGLGQAHHSGPRLPDRGRHGVTSVRKTAAMLNRDVLGWLAGNPPGSRFSSSSTIMTRTARTPSGDPDPRFGMAALPLAEQREIDKRFWDYAAGKPVPAGFTPQQIISEGYQPFSGFLRELHRLPRSPGRPSS